MKIIIAGIGKLGEYLAKCLTADKNEVTIIDETFKTKERIINNEDLNYVTGNALDIEVLRTAGIKDCDILICTMDMDEKNVMCSLLGKKLGAKQTIVRIRDNNYKKCANLLKDDLGLSMIINPELQTASHIFTILSIPSVIDAFTFFKGKIHMVSIKIKKDSILNNMSLNTLSKKISGHIIVSAIVRNNKTFIPTGKTIFEENDKVYITGQMKNINEFLKYLDLIKTKTKNVIISGGSKIAKYLAQMLMDTGINVKIIDIDPQKCEQLSAELPNCMIINGDVSDKDVLYEQNIENADAFICLNNIDEENIVYSMYASKFNVPKIITKTNHIKLDGINKQANLDIVVTPHKITSNQIVQYVSALKSGANSSCEAIYNIDESFEMQEYNIKIDFPGCNVKLKNLNFNKNILIAAIKRDNDIIFPSGNDMILPNDTIIISDCTGNIKNIKDILS